MPITLAQLLTNSSAVLSLVIIASGINIDTGTVSTHYFSAGEAPPDAPKVVHPVAALEGQWGIDIGRAIDLSTGSESVSLGAGASTALEYGAISIDYSDNPRLREELRRISFEGYAVEIRQAGSIGGEHLPWEAVMSPDALLVSGVGGRGSNSGGLRSRTIPVSAPTTGLEDPVTERYLGLGQAIAFDGVTTSIAIDGSALQPPGDWTFQAYIQAPETAEEVVRVFAHRFVSPAIAWIYDGQDARPQAYIQGFAGGEEYSARSERIAEPGRFYWLTVIYDADGSIECFVDDGQTADPGEGRGPLAVIPNDLIFGVGPSGIGNYRGVAGEFRIWHRALTRGEAIEAQAGRLPIADKGHPLLADLKGYWPGDTNLAVDTLYDYVERDPATGTSPLDGVITGGAIAHTLEGGDALAGQFKPAVEGYGANLPAMPVAPGFGVYQVADHLTLGPFGPQGRLRLPPGVYDRLSGLEFEGIVNDLVDFFEARPSVGGYTWYPPLSLFRVGLEAEGSIFTASMWGRGDWRGGAYFSGAGSGVLLQSLVGETMDAGGWTIEGYLYLHDSVDDVVLFDRRLPDGTGGMRVSYRNIPSLGLVVETSLGTNTGPKSRWIAGRQVQPGRPFHFAWAVAPGDDDGEPVIQERWWVNGRPYTAPRVSEGTAPGDGLEGLRIGRQHSADTRHAPMILSDLRIWSAARSDAQIREYYLRSPRGVPGLAHYAAMETELGMWAGMAVPGEARATWSGGVPMSELTAIVARQLVAADGIDAGALDVERALQDLPDAPLCVPIGNAGMSRLEVIDTARRSLGVALVRDHAGDCWCLRQHRDPRAEVAPKRLRKDDVGEVETDPVAAPPLSVRMGWGPVASTLTPDQVRQVAGEEARAYVGEAIRYVTERYESNRGIYPLASEVHTIEGVFADLEDALLELRRRGRLIAPERGQSLTSELRVRPTDILPGDVVIVPEERLEGGEIPVFVLTVGWAPGGSGARASLMGLVYA